MRIQTPVQESALSLEMNEREREESLKQFIKTLSCIRLVNNTLQIPRTSLKSIFWSDESYKQQLELRCTQKVNIK
jgi:hypothetical protein